MLIRLGNVLQPEHAGIDQIELKQQRGAAFGLALDLQVDFDLGFGQWLGADIDLNVDVGLLLRWLQ
jgi:hypothetical protein